MRVMNAQNFSDIQANYCCHVCGQSTLEIVPGYEMFSQVTSDCKPWPAGNRLGICQSCGCVQKIIDQKWRFEMEKIYKNYSIYHQSGGIEQAVFDKDSGQASSRSARLLECLKSQINLPATGRILDVGCGNGGLLRSFARLFPKWSIAGTEYDDRYRKAIENITANSTLYTCPLENIHKTFDLITMLHILEHVLDPVTFLKHARGKLEDGGFLVVDVPDYQQNPVDLLIADHCTHFTLSTLARALKKAGFAIVIYTTDWIPKEISIVAKKELGHHQNQSGVEGWDSEISQYESVIKCLKWVEFLREAVKKISVMGNFGIFGTSIAATWLFSEIGESVSFFVDEDPQRAGKTYMGRPIYHSQDVPKGSHIFLALPSEIASVVFRRLTRADVKFHLPPLLKV